MAVKLDLNQATKLAAQEAVAATTDDHNGHGALDSPVSEAGRQVSEALYWAEYYAHLDFAYEWNNGILEEKPMADFRNARLYRWFLLLLEAYLQVNPIAKLVNLEMGFRLALPTKTTIRKPDLFAIRNDNPVPIHDDDYTYAGIADLCIESISDSTFTEVRRDTVVKKGEYAGVGVQEYYILDAQNIYTAFYQRRPSGAYDVIPAGVDGVIRSQVLPGFQFRQSDLLRRPPLLQLADDPVYQGYVMLEYQAERARAERLAAQLRALGVDTE